MRPIGTTRLPLPAASPACPCEAAAPDARLSSAGYLPLQGRCTRRGIWMSWLPRSTLPLAASGISLNYKRLDEDTEILSCATGQVDTEILINGGQQQVT